MGKGVTIGAMTTDNIAPEITSMLNVMQKFHKLNNDSKDIISLSDDIDSLFEEGIQLNKNVQAAKIALTEAKKKYATSKNMGTRMFLQTAQSRYKYTKYQLGLVTKELHEKERELNKVISPSGYPKSYKIDMKTLFSDNAFFEKFKEEPKDIKNLSEEVPALEKRKYQLTQDKKAAKAARDKAQNEYAENQNSDTLESFQIAKSQYNDIAHQLDLVTKELNEKGPELYKPISPSLCTRSEFEHMRQFVSIFASVSTLAGVAALPAYLEKLAYDIIEIQYYLPDENDEFSMIDAIDKTLAAICFVKNIESIGNLMISGEEPALLEAINMVSGFIPSPTNYRTQLTDQLTEQLNDNHNSLPTTKDFILDIMDEEKSRRYFSALGTKPSSRYSTSKGISLLPYGYGLSYVPYDNFPALLHEGERVLTASEARSYGSDSVSVVVSGNNFSIREEADVEKVARAIARQMNKAYIIAS